MQLLMSGSMKKISKMNVRMKTLMTRKLVMKRLKRCVSFFAMKLEVSDLFS